MLVLLLVVSWGLFSHQGRTTATTSERSQVGIYFDEISPNPPLTQQEGPVDYRKQEITSKFIYK